MKPFQKLVSLASAATLAALALGAQEVQASAPSRTAQTVQDVLGRTLDVGPGMVLEMTGISSSDAEGVLASSKAALWLPGRGAIRFFVGQSPRAALVASGGRIVSSKATVASFLSELPDSYPGFTEESYLLAFPATFPVAEEARERLTNPASAKAKPAGPGVQAAALIFKDDFETGLSAWTTYDNTTGAHKWGQTACDKHAGSHAAGILAGGSAYTSYCTEQYPDNYRTDLIRASCDNVTGAAVATLDLWIQVNCQGMNGSTKTDYLGVTYMNDAGTAMNGPAYLGTTGTWTHLNLDMSDWPGIGNLTAKSCRPLDLLFISDGSTHYAYGARVDDVSVMVSTGGGPASCVSDATTLCLHSNRFRVTADYVQAGAPGHGQAVKLAGADDSGYFWFFDPKNMEVVAKIASFCTGGSGGEYGFYVSGLTDLQVNVTVTDTTTGQTWTKNNPNGASFCKDATGGFHCP
jgi:hypothetical protein